ncbi:MAG: ABC transporter permease subunit [Beijerinckiaceae bacterium]
MIWRIASLAGFLLAWQLSSGLAGATLLPSPEAVLMALVEEARSGALALNLLATLARVAAAFAVALLAGAAIGYAMGRSLNFDRVADPWLILLLNLPALVIILLAYIWFGLTEAAAVGAVAINKLPNTIATLREGTRALDPTLDEMGQAFTFDPWTRARHIVVPQLAPYLAAAARTGLSLVWKIVLVVELIGRPNGVGFAIGTAFQLFDVARILAYGLCFVAVMLAIETCLVQPLERHASRWRSRKG